ncbi:MAG: hypothetical protein JXA96_15280 [Sedimentisphaerales bacterium]|nr:hypothetical protein [Sedimentisphaerales bacterium]
MESRNSVYSVKISSFLFVMIFLLLTCPLSFGKSSLGNNIDMETIAEGIITAEEQYRDLQLKWTHETYPNIKNPSTTMYEGTYAYKIKDSGIKMQYYDYKMFINEPNSTERILKRDWLCTYNGDHSVWLQRSLEEEEPSKAYVDPVFSQRFAYYSTNPFNIALGYFAGKEPLGRLIKEHLDECEIENSSEILNGIQVVCFSIIDKNTGGGMRYWLSPEYNFLPLKCQTVPPQNRSKSIDTVFEDFVKLPNGMWFPKTIRTPSKPEDFSDKISCDIYKYSEIKVDSIPEDFFSLSIPDNTIVIDSIANLTYTTVSDENPAFIADQELINPLIQSESTDEKIIEYVESANIQVSQINNHNQNEDITNQGNNTNLILSQNLQLNKKVITFIIVISLVLFFILLWIGVFIYSKKAQYNEKNIRNIKEKDLCL